MEAGKPKEAAAETISPGSFVIFNIEDYRSTPRKSNMEPENDGFK